MSLKGKIMEKIHKKLYIGLLIAALITPIGIFLPRWFNAGDAWGEWSIETIKEKIGYAPAGMEKNEKSWKAPMQDYSVGNEEKSVARQSGYYILSAVIGLTIIAGFSYFLLKLSRKE
jgi:cobalt/nickel transport protein